MHTSQKLTSTHDIDDDVKRLDLEEASYDTEATKSTPSPLEQEVMYMRVFLLNFYSVIHLYICYTVKLHRYFCIEVQWG